MAGEISEKLVIQLLIGNKTHSVTVKRSEEEYFRSAAKMINDKLNRYRTAYPDKVYEDYVSVVLIDIAVSLVKMRDANDTKPYIDVLEKLGSEVLQTLKG